MVPKQKYLNYLDRARTPQKAAIATREDLLADYRIRLDAFSKAEKILGGYMRSKNDYRSIARREFDMASSALVDTFDNYALTRPNYALRENLGIERSEAGTFRLIIAVLDRNETPMLKASGITAKLSALAGAVCAAGLFALPPLASRLGVGDWMPQALMDPD
jgi:hypothetical protein